MNEPNHERLEEQPVEEIRKQEDEEYQKAIYAMLTEDIAALDPLFKQRQEIEAKIATLQKQADEFDADIQAHLDKKAELEKKGVELLETGKKPNLAKQLHDMELSLAELTKWRKTIGEKIDSFAGDLDEINEKISEEWRVSVLNPIKDALNEELAWLVMRIESQMETWPQVIYQVEHENNIIRKFSPPRTFIPYTRAFEVMRPAPHNAVSVIQAARAAR